MDNQRQVASLIRVENKQFGPGDRVVIDGHEFVNCFFGACQITYSGGKFGMDNVTFDGTTIIECVTPPHEAQTCSVTSDSTRKPSARP